MSALSLEWMLLTSQVCSVTLTHSDHYYHNMKHKVIRGSDHNYHDYHNMKWLEATHCILVWFTQLFSGKKTGDTKLINNNGKAEVYQVSWHAHTHTHWLLLTMQCTGPGKLSWECSSLASSPGLFFLLNDNENDAKIRSGDEASSSHENLVLLHLL